MAAEFCRSHVGPTIIYITTQANSTNVALALQAKGLQTRAYHAGLDPAERKSVQDWFMTSSTAVVCATIAFGMVRRVVSGVWTS
jgi:ATP-dependent DNA helicase RecQ